MIGPRAIGSDRVAGKDKADVKSGTGGKQCACEDNFAGHGGYSAVCIEQRSPPHRKRTIEWKPARIGLKCAGAGASFGNLAPVKVAIALKPVYLRSVEADVPKPIRLVGFRRQDLVVPGIIPEPRQNFQECLARWSPSVGDRHASPQSAVRPSLPFESLTQVRRTGASTIGYREEARFQAGVAFPGDDAGTVSSSKRTGRSPSAACASNARWRAMPCIAVVEKPLCAPDLRASRSPPAVAVGRPACWRPSPCIATIVGCRPMSKARATGVGRARSHFIVLPLRAPVCEPRGVPAHHLRWHRAVKSQPRSGSRFYYAAIEMPRRVREHRHHHGEAREKRQSANRQAAGNGESPDGHHLRVLENRCQ